MHPEAATIVKLQPLKAHHGGGLSGRYPQCGHEMTQGLSSRPAPTQALSPHRPAQGGEDWKDESFADRAVFLGGRNVSFIPSSY